MKLTSLIKESIDDKAADLWNKYKGRIYNDPQVMNPKNIAVAVLTDPLWAIKWIEDWASKNDDEYEHPDDFPPKDKALEAIKEYVKENLRNWFKKEKWKRIDTQGNIKGDCGTMPKGKKTQRCLPAAKARSLSKKDRAATSRKKTKSNKQFVSNTKKAKVKLNK